jgi:hypothetical protein
MSRTLNSRYVTPSTRPVLATHPPLPQGAASGRPQVCLSGSRLDARRGGGRLVSFDWGGISLHASRR